MGHGWAGSGYFEAACGTGVCVVFFPEEGRWTTPVSVLPRGWCAFGVRVGAISFCPPAAVCLSGSDSRKLPCYFVERIGEDREEDMRF